MGTPSDTTNLDSLATGSEIQIPADGGGVPMQGHEIALALQGVIVSAAHIEL
jgi:hypothetical protein